MKKTVLTVGIAMLFIVGSATFIGCGNDENHEGDHHEHAEGEEHEHEAMEMNTEEHSHFQCSMKCEGDKTYEEDGDCPVCGMELVELDEDEVGEHE
jgi:ABC-type Zn2+ transport system substrate-binding protein/surface adhesin